MHNDAPEQRAEQTRSRDRPGVRGDLEL